MVNDRLKEPSRTAQLLCQPSKVNNRYIHKANDNCIEDLINVNDCKLKQEETLKSIKQNTK